MASYGHLRRSEISLWATWKCEELYGKLALFKHLWETSWWQEKFNGRFRTKEWLNRKKFGDLFGPKWGGEYISIPFKPPGIDFGWSEIVFRALWKRSQVCLFLPYFVFFVNFSYSMALRTKLKTLIKLILKLVRSSNKMFKHLGMYQWHHMGI